MKGNDLTFNNSRWGVEKTHQIIWQKLFEYARIAWDVMQTKVERVVMYDKMIGKYDEIWRRNELLYHRENN